MRRKNRTKVCICLSQTWQQCTQLTSSWLYNILPFSSMSHLMMQRPESQTDAGISTGLIRIIPHTNERLRVSQPKPADFCLGAQMIPCVPVITRPLTRQPTRASLTGRLKTPGGRHHPAACLPGDVDRWMFVATARQRCLWWGFAEWHGKGGRRAVCFIFTQLFAVADPPHLSTPPVTPPNMTSNGIRYQTRWEWSIKYNIFDIITFF